MKWEDFLPRVLPYVIGCPRDLALEHIVDAARAFASRTRVWQFQATTIPTIVGIADYTIQLEPGQELVAILVCEVDGKEFDVVPGVEGRKLARRGVGDVCIPTGPQDFQLSPTPSIEGLGILTDLAVKPALEGCEKWPDDLDTYVTDIVCGALATLLAIPGPGITWRDDAAAMSKAGHFNDRMAVVQAEVARNYGPARRRNRTRFF